MTEILSLEIAEGCLLNNRIREIEKAFTCYVRMGTIHYRRGEKYLALTDYRKALITDPDNGQIHKLKEYLYNTMTDLIYDMYSKARSLYRNKNYTISLFYYTNVIAYCIETHQLYLPIVAECRRMIDTIRIKQGDHIYDISGDGIDYLNEL